MYKKNFISRIRNQSSQYLKSHQTLKIFLTLLFLFTLNTQYCHSQWQWQNPMPQGNILFGSFYLNENTGWACGDGGTIIRTTNSGLNWTVTSTQTKQSIRSVFFVNENTGFAAGLYGTVLTSTNSGVNWNKILLNTTGNLFSVRFLNSNTGFIVGDTGIVFRTSNGGSTWNRKTTNVTNTLTSCAVRDSIVLAAGLYGTLVRSSNYGETFQIVNPNNNNYLFDVMFKDANTAFIAGAYGTILRSTNAGLSWSGTTTSTNRWFYSISFGDASTGFASGDYGNIYKTTNGGSSWTAYGTSTSEFQYAIQAFNANDIISVGNKGTIIKSYNSGVNWSDLSFGFRNTMFSIDFSDLNNGMSCGAQGTVAVTSDGGGSWQRVQAASDNAYLNQIEIAGPGASYCVGEEGLIIKSVNGGNNWTELSSGVFTGLYSSFFFDENTGWICGDSGKLILTTNGGNTFNNIDSKSNRYISDIYFINPNTGWYASGEKKIYKTTNGGNDWFTPDSTVFSGGVGAVQFVNAHTGIAFTFDNKILITSNGGTNWRITNIPANNYLNNVFAIDDLNFYAIGDFGFIYRSTDGGQSWYQENNNNFDTRLFGIYFTDRNNGWLAGGNGMIAKYTGTPSNVFSENNSGNIKSFYLCQNFPNPFNPETIINYELQNTNYVSLEIFDMLGKRVESLIDKKQAPGKYSVKWNASGYSSGTYFYKLETDAYSETKSMVLLK